MSSQFLLPKHKRTVFTASGSAELGRVKEDMAIVAGVPAGQIRLLEGFQSAGGGFGRQHIESHASRMLQLRNLGFRDAISYVFYVASGFECLARHEDGRISIVRKSASLFHQVVCQWDPALDLWSVTTAIPKNNMRNLNVVWEK